MCDGSKKVKKSKAAVVGETYGIGTMGVHYTHGVQLGGLHELGKSVKACLICVPSDQKITLSNIPKGIQKRLGIADTAVATFQESPNYDDHDRVVLENGANVPLLTFANCGVLVLIGAKSATDLISSIGVAPDEAPSETNPARDFAHVG